MKAEDVKRVEDDFPAIEVMRHRLAEQAFPVRGIVVPLCRWRGVTGVNEALGMPVFYHGNAPMGLIVSVGVKCQAEKRFVAVPRSGFSSLIDLSAPDLVLRCDHESGHGGTHHDPETSANWR